MKIVFSIFLLLLASTSGFAQDVNGIWHFKGNDSKGLYGKPDLEVSSFVVFSADESSLKEYFSSLPHSYDQARVISLPTPEGGYRDFRIWTTPMMEELLASKYPEISTFTAEAVDNHFVTAKLDYTPSGFHAMIFDGNKTYLIDPYSTKSAGDYIVYYKSNHSRPVNARMVCDLTAEDSPEPGAFLMNRDGVPGLQDLINGTIRKTYRLALAADSEYCIAVAGPNPTKAAVLAKMVTTMNRVNGIYQRELAVQMILVANEDTLIFNTTAPDPYTNNSGSAMLSQNQATVNARIGSANYDIGHVFSTGGGGIATKSSVCKNSSKAQGVTGSTSPVGDAFDVDYVAHEMGHQFGADHTFNANNGSCASNGVSSTAYEPGGGTTIMGYAGICGSDNIQQHSDAYFHSASLGEITNYITTGSGATCAASSVSTNGNAGVPPFAATYLIPYKTPFELTAPTATDITADTLTYCWEQRDLGDFKSSLSATRLNGPLFRSFPPRTSPTRVFPDLIKVVQGSAPLSMGEKLPDTARTMNFRMTERDVFQGWGAFNFPSDAISLNVINTGAAFKVTAPDGSIPWHTSTQQTVTWDVVSTDAAPINTANVDIYLSVDGGYNYPVLLKANTPNDGSEVVDVPDMPGTTTARVKVKGSGNVFFSVSPFDLTIINPSMSVAKSSWLDRVQIVPMPAGDFLQITKPQSLEKLKLQIHNAVGQIIWQADVNEKIRISVADWPRGLYKASLISESGDRQNRKLVLQ